MGQNTVKTTVEDIREVETFGLTGNPLLDMMYGGFKITADTNGEYWLSYSFPNAESQWSSNQSYFSTLEAVAASGRRGDAALPGTEHLREMASVTDAQKEQFVSVLNDLRALTNLEFVEVADSGNNAGTTRLAWTNTKIADGWAYPAGANPIGGDFWMYKTEKYLTEDITELARHEFSHVLGLKDSFAELNGFTKIPDEYDGNDYSVMAYNPSTRVDGTDNYSGADLYPQSYMYLDVLALQHLYGTDTVTTGGDDTFVYSQKERHHLTIWDAGGEDSFLVTEGKTDTEINLTPGSWSDVGTKITYFKDYRDPSSEVIGDENMTIFIMPDTIIENASGAAGSDKITGNDAANHLSGNDGNDTITGGKASDTLIGGAGDDALWAGKEDDAADLMEGGAGNDTIGGGAGADTIIGGNGTDVLYGGDGGDQLFGQESKVISETDVNEIWAGAGNDFVQAADGNDKLGGGLGDDRIVAAGGDDVIFAGKTGNDTLDAGAGNDKVYAGTDNDSVMGGTGDDLLYAGSGDDVVDAGSGADTLYGGGGNDTLIGGSGADVFYFAGGHGADVIKDFDIQKDQIDVSSAGMTPVDFLGFLTKVTSIEKNGVEGLLIDTGDDSSVFLEGLVLTDLVQTHIVF